MRLELFDLQGSCCFYCRSALSLRDIHVDHFVPWSRVPNDGLTNLVVADGRCNGAKRDNYPDLDLLARWAERPVADLADIAANVQWPLRRDESLGIARSLYGLLPAGSRLWSAPGRFTILDATRRSDVLAKLVS